MPPKRAASGAAANGPAKRSKKAAAAPEPPAPEIPRSKRWSAVSASANVDAEFKFAIRDPEKAASWICICPRSSSDNDNDEDEDDFEEDDEEEPEAFGEDSDDDEGSSGEAAGKSPRKGKTKCDAGRTCICRKPADDHPDHDWTISYPGFRKWISQLSMCPLRDPDVFGMYTYNDHAAYGIMEILENLVLDFSEASSWKDQWVICEALVMFFTGPGLEFSMCEDGDKANDLAELCGRLFLTMLARLEREKLLQDQSSEVRNLGLMMSLYIRLASDLREGSLLEDGQVESVKGSSPRFSFKPSEFDAYILAYANKFAITLKGLDEIDELVAELDTNARLPTSGEDPWGWDATLKSYSKDYAAKPAGGRGKTCIGGDGFDITTWSSSERKGSSFNGKDPLTKKDIDALKSGKIMQLV